VANSSRRAPLGGVVAGVGGGLAGAGEEPAVVDGDAGIGVGTLGD
jgi:hypothetical protein